MHGTGRSLVLAPLPGINPTKGDMRCLYYALIGGQIHSSCGTIHRCSHPTVGQVNMLTEVASQSANVGQASPTEIGWQVFKGGQLAAIFDT
jgi:hypothetical protein